LRDPDPADVEALHCLVPFSGDRPLEEVAREVISQAVERRVTKRAGKSQSSA
jgi:hypothetical protein